MHPLDGNPLESRTDLQEAVRSLLAPLERYASPGGARVRPGVSGAHFPAGEAELEGFARPLWGAAPLAAGGGAFDHWERYRSGLAAGTDPAHEEYWGEVTDHSQTAVEMAPIGVALALAGDELWEPLSVDTRAAIADWLRGINDVDVPDGNWRFFRVLANEGLRAVEADPDDEQVCRDLDRLESFALQDGWYRDGPEGACDYYTAWELHTDGLVYATLAGDRDPERADRLRERARAFAGEFDRWFAADGSALPFGRSLTYRFAQGAFWGALAFSGVEAFPWGELKARWLRHLRWWVERPIFTADGVLSLGYAYPTLKMTEPYNSPSSPYWAMKFFLPLALDADHPFWQAEERVPDRPNGVATQRPAGMVIQPDGDQVCALCAGTDGADPEKYNKFVYSTRFGTNVADGNDRFGGAPDSTFLLSDDGERFRRRRRIVENGVSDGVVHSRWEPWDDVAVDSWLAPALPWHVRLHRIETDRELISVEGGFPVPADGHTDAAGEGTAVAATGVGDSLLRALEGAREAAVELQSPNTNLLFPRTVVPTLSGEHPPGTTWLATAVLGGPAGTASGHSRADPIEDTGTDRCAPASDGTAALSHAWGYPPATVSGGGDVVPDPDVAGPVYDRSGTEHVLTWTDGETLLRIDANAPAGGIDSQ
ncbi:hypothetical protein HLRTI_002422 [Halorhabdus tiamatea SARL4B]|uniref:DUF2264 domain-containing protein n=2 Tax=Halorhabdus tiamatea SARL4B TaxID=1033806 RepID=F7PHK5_9EURY|nr:DUF2264 domain-containing protein [Halorhabdus tiamatea]ERJ05612.1 hypothetical protein HLRTI_002422 [Halorhabdus tiamatea SARL4B]CCQ34995.1 conserved hypothetical protein (UCP014753) [Halorhabdus tiamatea SARL4B]